MSTVSILNELITIAKDGEQGFLKVAEEVQDQKLQSLFTEKAHERADMVKELQKLVAASGEEPATTGSLLGVIHRGWIDIKAALTNRSTAQIIAECERGEDVAKAAYSNALEASLPEEIRSVIEMQYQKIKQSYNTVRDLENEYEEESEEVEN